jgi:hypothetical protein
MMHAEITVRKYHSQRYAVFHPDLFLLVFAFFAPSRQGFAFAIFIYNSVCHAHTD